MKAITESPNKARFPRQAVSAVECRKQDLVFRITDWTRDADEPGFDVETYVAGVYDFNLSKVFSTRSSGRTKQEAKQAAIKFVQDSVAKLL